jgi:protein gp37
MLTGDTVWWDTSWNPIAGCKPVSPGCLNCYAAKQAGTLHQRAGAKRQARSLYAGIVNKAKGGGYAFNGKYTAELSGDPSWTFPLDYEGANHPLLGPGMPSLIFVGSMTDLFLEGRPDAIIDRVVGTVAQSEHLGLLLTRRAHRGEQLLRAGRGDRHQPVRFRVRCRARDRRRCTD